MIQLAHGVGKREWASRVSGYDNTAKRTGGITNRNLVKTLGQSKKYISNLCSRVHWKVVMNTVHQEM